MKNEINIYEQGQIELLFAHSGHSFPLHSHESWCIGMVREGEVTFKIHNQESTLKKGMMYIIPSNTGVVITCSKAYKYVVVCIKGTLIQQVKNIELREYFVKLSDEDIFLKPCLDFMWNGDEEKLVQDLLSILPSYTRIDDVESKRSKVVEDAIDYIKNLENDKFSLDNIALSVNVSKYHLVRVFKKEVGVTPNQYYIQNKLRIVKKEILTQQSESVIASDLNYADQSHLCRQFKQMMGISLQEYKRNIKKK